MSSRGLSPNHPLRPADAAGPERAALAVHLWDERLSTAEAYAALDAAGQDSRRAPRGKIDQLAAALILQGWLDAQSGSLTLLPAGRLRFPAVV